MMTSLLAQIRNRLASTPDQLLQPWRAAATTQALDLGIEDVVETFIALSKDPLVGRRPFLRTYREGQMMPSYEQVIASNPPTPGQDLFDWGNQVFTSCKFGIIVNNAERWAGSLTQKVALALGSVLDGYDIDRLRLDINLFLGDYGFTPFGIHLDPPCCSVIHFHIGPGKKVMSLYEPDLYKRLTGSDRKLLRPREILAHGRHFEIRAGDVFFLPANYYHVGLTDGFSIGIACSITHLSNETMAKRAIEGEVAGKSSTPRTWDAASLTDSLCQAFVEDPRQSIGDWFGHIAAKFHARQQSLQGFYEPPVRLSDLPPQESYLTLAAPFPLVKYDSDQSIVVLARGHELPVQGQSDADLIDRLNGGGAIRPSDLRGTTEVTLLAELYQCQAVQPL